MSKASRPGGGADEKKDDRADGTGHEVEIEVIEPDDFAPGGPLEVDEEERIEALSKDIEQLAAQNTELLDALKRLKADFDNYRKRMIKEQTRVLETAEADLVKKLLPVIDNLERALASAGDTGQNTGLAEGVAKVFELMLDTLAREGLEVIDPEGEPFDPEHHEAMMVVETDECPEDTVTDVIQKGYRFAGALLRPAMVRVSCPVKR